MRRSVLLFVPVLDAKVLDELDGRGRKRQGGYRPFDVDRSVHPSARAERRRFERLLLDWPRRALGRLVAVRAATFCSNSHRSTDEGHYADVVSVGSAGAVKYSKLGGPRRVYRFVALTLGFVAACSSSTVTQAPPDAALSDAAAPDSSTAADAGSGSDSSSCRPSGASCADNIASCCSSSCTATVDIHNNPVSHCD